MFQELDVIRQIPIFSFSILIDNQEALKVFRFLFLFLFIFLFLFLIPCPFIPFFLN